MKRNKIFRWLYFIILLLPVMFVLIPMINNYQPSVKSESVEIVEYGSIDTDIFPFLQSVSYCFENGILNIRFNDLYPYLSYYGYKNNTFFSFYVLNNNDEVFYFHGKFLLNTYSDDSFVCGMDINNVYFSDGFTFNNDDDDNIYESFSLNTNIIGDSLSLIFDSYNYVGFDYLYMFYYKDYVINTEYNSIFYDFSVKMNDSFLFIGNFTEFVSDNIIDLSSNDYVFFAFTYMTYIFVISLLWLLFEFLMFIINFTHKYMERFYE